MFFSANIAHFNSTMVRLKDGLKRTGTFLQVHFNSTMVRLKGCSITNYPCPGNISIPLWFG